MNTNRAKTVYDCAIIGGGVIGCLCARELSRYTGDFVLLEKCGDICRGTSKANSGIVHAGYDALPGTLKAKYNVLGSRLMPKVCEQLQVPYKVNGALVLALEDSGLPKLNELLLRGKSNGVKGLQILSGEAVTEKEPNLSRNVLAALFAPTSAIVSPYELTIAAAENFTANGGTLLTEYDVTGIEQVIAPAPHANNAADKSDRVYKITAAKGVIFARTVINAAGLYSDAVSAYIGKPHTITARRGEYLLTDKSKTFVSHTVFQTPSSMGKGVLIAPTCHGNTIIGPTAQNVPNKSDVSTTADGIAAVLAQAKRSVEAISVHDCITRFAGNRAVSETDDFILEEADEGFFNAVGIASPGLAASPAIAERLAGDVAEKLRLGLNKAFDPYRAAIPCFAEASEKERARLIAENPQYANIVCRCELVTQAEVAEAVRRGARDLDGIKFRVRAGMGRCQGGFCTPHIIRIASEILGVPPSYITKRGKDSNIIY